MRFLYLTLVTLLVLGTLSLPAMADTEDDIDEIMDRLDALELSTAKNKVSFFGDFRVRYDYTKWHVGDYSQFMGMDFSDPMNPVPVYMPVPSQDLENTEAYSARLRLKMDARIGESLHFTGRLNMHRGFGASNIPLFNGFPNTVLTAYNSTAVPTDNLLRVERAAFTWDPDFVPLFLTAGRQAATGGPPRELREGLVRQGTPGALMIDAEIDGFMLGVHLPNESVARICYGTGFEAGFGPGGSTGQTVVTTYVPDVTDPSNPRLVAMPNFIGGLKDSKVLGGCAETSIPPIPGTTMLSAGYFRMMNMTDIPYGRTRSFPNPFNTDEQTVTATANLGDMDLYGLCFQHNLDLQGYELDWFVSVAGNTSHPDAGTASAYGFGSLLGNSMESQSGNAYFVGVRGDIPPTRGKLGFEYNHGSKNWFSYIPAADDINSKLATRGSVFEGYYIQPLDLAGLNLRVGYQYYDYDYAFSGWHISPAPIDYFKLDENPSSPYPYPDEIQNLYVVLDLNF